MTCRLCGLAVPLIKAHIIPKPFFDSYNNTGRPPRVLQDHPKSYPKRIPIGFYDNGILCGPCDNGIGRWDEYATEILIRRLSDFSPIDQSDLVPARTLPRYDHQRLKLFFLSLLWRAGESTLPAFKRVRLGNFASTLRQLIRAHDPGDPEAFSVVLSVFGSGSTFPEEGIAILDPHREKWSGINTYRFSLGVVTAHIKVDQRPFRPPFSRLILTPDAPLYLVTRDYATSAELRLARRIAQAPHNRRALPRE